MAAFTPAELDNLRAIVGAIIKGDPGKKARIDEALKVLSDSMRKSMPTADNEVLAEFSATVAYISAALLKTSTQHISDVLTDLFESYEILTSYLVGVYDPADPAVPDVESPDLSKVFGVDEETIKRFREFQKQEQAAGTATAVPDHIGQYL